MKTVKKLLIAIIAVIGIMAFNQVYADFEVFDGEEGTVNKRFYPHDISGEEGMFFCIQGGTSYNATLNRGYTPGETRGTYYGHNGTQPPWSGNRTSMIYTKTEQISMQSYQDAAYILANIKDDSIEGYGIRTGYNMEGQYAIWSTPLNQGRPEEPNDLADEAAAYKSFYEYIHNVKSDYVIDSTTDYIYENEEGSGDFVYADEVVIISYNKIGQIVNEQELDVNDFTYEEFRDRMRGEIGDLVEASMGREMTSSETRRLDTYSKQYYNDYYEADEYASSYDPKTDISYEGVAKFVGQDNINLSEYTRSEFRNLIIDYYRDKVWEVYARDLRVRETNAIKQYSEQYYDDHDGDYTYDWVDTEEDSSSTRSIKYQDIVDMVEDEDIDLLGYTLDEFQELMVELFTDKINEEKDRDIKKTEIRTVEQQSEKFYRRHLYDDNLDNDDIWVDECINLNYKGIREKVDNEEIDIEDYTLSEFQELMVDLYLDEISDKFGRDITDDEIDEVEKYAKQYYKNDGEDLSYDYVDEDDYEYDEDVDELNIITNKEGQSDSTDRFSKLLKNKTDMDDVHNMVDRDDDYYIVGPFNITYPDGEYDGINKFSWISNVRIYDQDDDEITNVEDGTLEIVDKNEDLIYDTDKDGNKLNVPQNGKDFYVKFYSTDVLEIAIKIDFGYLESCPTEAYKYAGTYQNWYWEYQYVGRHRTSCNRHGSHYCCDKYKYVLRKESAESSQLLMEVVKAEKNYKTASMWIPYEIDERKKIDLTMSIAGKVFLDEDQGKANEGNNTYDDGEELEGIDVWLYDSNNKLIDVKVTDKNGNYKFTKLNAQKEYYVQFVYNGMLYTNVDYEEEGKNASKATESAQGHSDNRNNFNNKFAEVGSYPQNYKTTDCITGASITNKVFEQGDIITLYKEVAKAMADKDGDEKVAYQSVINAHSSDSEIKAKVQYIADCRIKAYTVTNYARHDSLIVEEKSYKVGKTTYKEIYYEQKYVNLGIKARPTFDLALYKDAFTADVEINGKNETYKYDARTANGQDFSIGVSESDYLNSVRQGYLKTSNYDNASTRDIETDSYDLDLRAEEVANGQIDQYIEQGKKVDQAYNSDANKYASYTNLSDVNNQTDRLKIYITYKIAIRNQSGVTGAVTEIVDYFDTNFRFVEAYEGDKNGNKTGNVNKYDESMYGTGTQYKNDSKYTTIYLRTEKENRLNDDNKEQYIYVKLQVMGTINQNDAGNFLSTKLLDDESISMLNLAEINGYKTYNGSTGNVTPGLVDIDSNPGNFDMTGISEFNQANVEKYKDTYEDDTSKAPAMIYKLLASRTIEGTVFEDSTGKENEEAKAGETREGNGLLDEGETKIRDVIVQLVEIKNGQMIVRAETRTNDQGWYGFTGFIPGEYTIRYIYGSDDQTAMTTSSWTTGSNDKSYNGQDYQSTKFEAISGGELTDQSYKTDTDLIERYRTNYNNKATDETTVNPQASTTIRKYQDGFYWYTNQDKALSDAKDDEYRKQLVINYSKSEYGREITNYKADVFNSYLPKEEQPSYVQEDKNYWRQLANELERRTYRYAYTPEITIEVEYAKQTTTGNTGQQSYEHAIKGVDFGIVERPKSKLELTKNVSNIKYIASDGTVLYDANGRTSNLAWTVKTDRYVTPDPIILSMDDELINGATIEITYKFTVTNNSESGEETAVIGAKNIMDYIDNNLTFNEIDNNGWWEVVTPESIQNDEKSTWINNKLGIDLSTIQTIIKSTDENPLVKNLAPGETAEATLVLNKVLAAESSGDQRTYENRAEIVEVRQVVGRYDRTSTPGNQDPEEPPTEDDTYESEIVKILPPFGETSNIIMYVVIGLVALIVLGGGIFLIKRYVVKK